MARKSNELGLQNLLSMHNYFYRLDNTKSEIAKEIIETIEKTILSKINPTPSEMEPK